MCSSDLDSAAGGVVIWSLCCPCGGQICCAPVVWGGTQIVRPGDPCSPVLPSPSLPDLPTGPATVCLSRQCWLLPLGQLQSRVGLVEVGALLGPGIPGTAVCQKGCCGKERMKRWSNKVHVWPPKGGPREWFVISLESWDPDTSLVVYPERLRPSEPRSPQAPGSSQPCSARAPALRRFPPA